MDTKCTSPGLYPPPEPLLLQLHCHGALHGTRVGSDNICNDPSEVLAQQLDSLNHVTKMLKPKLLIIFHKVPYILN